MNRKISNLIYIAICVISLSSCAHFSSSTFQEEYRKGDPLIYDTSNTVFLKVNNYANWSDYSSVNSQVADALREGFLKKGIKIEVISEQDKLPDSYIEIVSIVDNTAGQESREFAPLSLLSAIWCGLSVFVLPLIDTDFDVLVKINKFDQGKIVSSYMYSSHIYQLSGFSMIPFMGSHGIGDAITSIVSNISQDNLELNLND